MLSRKTRTAVVLCGMTLVLAGAPAKSHAIFDWLCPWAKKDQTASTSYIPPYSGRPAAAAPAGVVAPIVTGVPSVAAGYRVPACGCAGVPTTCSYVPQTCYRTVYGPVPVASCLPVRSYDPCSGCPVVTYRPVTSWTRQAMLQPYTTYRIVYNTTALRAVPGCPTAPCAGACGYTPAAVGQVANLPYAGCGFTGGIAAPGCSSCASGMSPPSTRPSTRISPVPMSAAPTPGSPYLGTTAYWPAPPATGMSGSWAAPAAAQPAPPVPNSSKSVTPPWPDTPKGPVAQPDRPKPSPLAPVLNAPNSDQPPVRPVRQASFSQPTVPLAGATPRVTLRLGPEGWEPVR
jgi:hypothetical protein